MRQGLEIQDCPTQLAALFNGGYKYSCPYKVFSFANISCNWQSFVKKNPLQNNVANSLLIIQISSVKS